MKIVNLSEVEKVDSLKALIYAKSGAGKTFSIKSFAKRHKVLLINMESGTNTMKDFSDEEKANIDVVSTKSLEEIREIYTYLTLKEHNYKTVVLDSLSELSDIVFNSVKSDPTYQDPKMALKMWGEIAEKQINICKSFRDIREMNVVLLALEEQTTKDFKDYAQPLMNGQKATKRLASLYDLVGRIELDEDNKRSLVLDSTNCESKVRSRQFNSSEPMTVDDPLGSLWDKGYLKN